MKFASRRNGTRDGELLIVSRDNQKAVVATEVAATMQALLDDWDTYISAAQRVSDELNRGMREDAFELDQSTLTSPLPRAYAWIDGSAYINHIVLVRKARNAEPPETLWTDPLVYQGGSDSFLGPRQTIPVADLEWGVDFEGEVAVIMGETPQGTSAATAGKHIRLFMLCNDVSLRNLIPDELAKSFGFFCSKPSSSFSPFAITPDELGTSLRDGRLHLALETTLNGEFYGNPDAGTEMHFSFHDLIAHVTKTRSLTAGTIIGSGTVSNVDTSRGSSCLAEKRMLEKIHTGRIETPFMKYGDTVSIEMFRDGLSLFGRIEQTVTPATPPQTNH